MIKHNSPNSVISPFNPVVALNPQVRKIVNEKFIYPILKRFFEDKGGINNYEELDYDKIKTDIEFSQKDTQESYVKSYVYKELMYAINKNNDGTINFKPRYVVSFDRDLTDFKSKEDFKWGELRLGNKPILYFIYIDLQELIQFVKKTITEETEAETGELKVVETSEYRRNKLIDRLVAEKYRALINAPQNQRNEIRTELNRLVNLSQQTLQGNLGKFRVNLSWNTTDDLDLEIETEGGIINYQNKIVEYQGVIGELDIDANASSVISNPQENITWEEIPKGKNKVSVNLFEDREKKEKVPFTIFIDNGDDSRIYNSFVESPGSNKTRLVVEFEFVNGELQLRSFV